MLAARLNFMDQGNPMVQNLVKEFRRSMARRERGGGLATSLVQYLKVLGPVKFYLQEESEGKQIIVYVDIDWTGRRTRRSTTEGEMKVERHVVRSWSSTQPTKETSSGEAELIALAEGGSHKLGCGL